MVKMSRIRSRSVLNDVNFRTHPGMDTALVAFDADFVGRLVKGIARVEHLDLFRIAFRDLSAEPPQVVQELNENAPEVVDLGKRVDFAAFVERLEHVTEFDGGLPGSHVPRADGVMIAHLIEEILKADASLSQTGPRPYPRGWRGVECVRIARIEQRNRFSVLCDRCELRSPTGAGNRHRVALIGGRRADGQRTSALAPNCYRNGCY